MSKAMQPKEAPIWGAYLKNSPMTSKTIFASTMSVHAMHLGLK